MIQPGVYRSHVLGQKVADAERILAEADDIYSDPAIFLKEWKRGYEENVGTVHCHRYPGGFELYLVSIDPADDYHQIPLPEWGWRGVDKWGKIDDFLLAADLGNICDVRDERRLVVNHIPTQRVLVCKEKEHVSYDNESRWEEGLLLDNESAYVGKPRYPFESVNLLKAVDNQWSLIGFTPEQFYDALEKTGFRFSK